MAVCGAIGVMAAPVMQAHKGGLVQAVGSEATMVTASRYGAVILWPEAELRSIAEGAGFVLPTRAPPSTSSTGGVTRQATISQVGLSRAYNGAILSSFKLEHIK